MKYSLEERFEIGKTIYNGNMTVSEAAVKYSINIYTARDYMRLYRDKNNLPAKRCFNANKENEPFDFDENKEYSYAKLLKMSKENLVKLILKYRKEKEDSLRENGLK